MNQPYAKKSLGQHWLNDQASLDSICEAAELSSEDTVLEVGPGPGSLTAQLVGLARQVVAVEFDDRFAAQLSQTVPAKNLRVVHQDILSYNLNELPADYKVVANIPYYLTSALLRTLSESANPPKTVVLLVQKEVAERVAAEPGDMSLLSVSVQLFYEASLGLHVPAHLFSPAPKVDSMVLILHRRPASLYPGINQAIFFKIVKAGFAARRKTLLNSLAGGLRLNKAATEKLLIEANLRPGMRPQELSLADWFRLYQVYIQD